MQVEGHQGTSLLVPLATGARVSNTYPTCPKPGDSPLKGGLIPDFSCSGIGMRRKIHRYGMGMRPISLLAG